MSNDQLAKAGYPVAKAEDEMLNEVPFSEARASFTSLVKLSAEEGQRVVVTKFGQPVAALVPIHDLNRLLANDAAVRETMEIDQSKDANLVDFEEDSDDSSDDHFKEDVGELVVKLLEDPTVQEYVNTHGDSSEKSGCLETGRVRPVSPSEGKAIA